MLAKQLNFPILMYHSIQKVHSSEVMKSLHVKPESLKLQLRVLKALGFKACSVSEAIEARQSGSSEKLVALTFDDGYRNFYDNALPLLKDLKFSATVYCVTDLIGSGNDWDRYTGISYNPLMSESQIVACINSGIEIGCHGASHISLTSSEADLAHEIGGAKQHLEQMFDVPVRAFCYPYGHYDEDAIAAVESSGFLSATTMVRSKATLEDNLFELPRIPITWHTLPHLFMIKLLTDYENRRRNK